LPFVPGKPRAAQALAPYRVVEISSRIAASFSAKFFADFGAEVVKIEPRGGAPERQLGPFQDDRPFSDSGLHLFLNTNKKSLTLELSTITGAEMLKALLREADVLIEGLPPGTLDAWGLTAEELERVNPDLVVASVSDYGQSGPYREYKAADIAHWAMSCLLVGSGLADREPLRVGDDVSEYVAGLNACATALAALFGRGKNGGQRIDLSVLEALITVQPSNALSYAYNKTHMPRAGNRFPMNIVHCKDGYIGFYPQFPHQWEMFADALGKPELKTDPKFATPLARMAHADEALAIILPWCLDRTCDEAVRIGQEHHVPFIKVANARDLVTSPQYRARGFFTDIGTRETGAVTAPGRPFGMSGTPWTLASKAPGLGQHNIEIFCNRLGFSKLELGILAEQGVL
jgi:crotonobetainyl-CoA:carnitine CoA-transferase CaiB-like acyl-CoA transferase